MAKQFPGTIITGTYGNLVFYEMDGAGYVRRKSSLSRKQFKARACFEGSRNSAACFARGNRIASEVYKALPVYKGHYPLFCTLKSKAIQLLKDGIPDGEINPTCLLPLYNSTSIPQAAPRS